MDRPEIILAPGPTPIPPEVLLAQGSPLVYHRGPGFGDLMREVTARLRELYRTDIAEIFLLTSSGTGGLESAVQNLLSPGDEVFVPLAGFFSAAVAAARDRLRPHGAHERGPVGDASSIPRRCASGWPSTRTSRPCCSTQSETSTGVIQPVQELAARRPRRRRAGGRRRGVESRRGAVRVRRLGDRRGRRRVAEGPVARARGSRSWPSSDAGARGRETPDTADASTSTGASTGTFAALPNPENPWTPAISVMQGLPRRARALLPGRGRRRAAPPRRRSAARSRTACGAIGLDLFGEGLEQNWTVTAIRAPEGIDADTICDTIRADFGCVLAPGQGPAQGHGVPDRALRLRQRARHHPRAGGARDDARAARVPGEAGRRRRRRRAGVPGGGLTGAGPRHRDPVRAGTRAAARRTSRSTCGPISPTATSPAEIAPYDALVIRSATQVTAAVLGAATNLKVIARAGHRPGQRRRRRGDAAGRDGRQRPAVQHHLRGRADPRAAAGAGSQHPPGARRPDRRPLGALEVGGRRARRQDDRPGRPRPCRLPGRRARRRVRDARDRLRPLRERRARQGDGRRDHADPRGAPGAVGLRVDPPAPYPRDRGPDRGEGAPDHQAGRARGEHRAGRDRRRGPPSARRWRTATSAAPRSTSSRSSQRPIRRCSGCPTPW